MQSINTAIKKAIQKAGIEKALKQQQAVFVWPKVVGKKIGKVTSAEGVKKGVLTIKTDSSVWRQELQMQKEEIILKINEKIGKQTIKEIKFIWTKTTANIVQKA